MYCLFKNSLIIHEYPCLMSCFICDKDTLAVLASFCVSNKVNFQNYFANKLIRWFAFETVQKNRSTCFIGENVLPRVLSAIASRFKPDKTQCCWYSKKLNYIALSCFFC